MAQQNDLEKIYDILTERQKSIISTYNGPEDIYLMTFWIVGGNVPGGNVPGNHRN